MIEPRAHLKAVTRTPNDEPSRLFKIRLDRNERNQAFSEQFVQKVKAAINGEILQVYPELDVIYEKTARWLKLNSDQILLHAGSDQAIKGVFETYINPGDQILLHFPGYAMYDIYAKTFQAQVLKQDFDSNLEFDWDAYIEKIHPGLRMVVAENPNGFLGVTVPLTKLRQLIEKAHATQTIALIDEAYFHFHNETVLPWLQEFDNLIISRTFSKAFGLAGIRAGYLLSQAENIDFLKRVRPVYEITALTAIILGILLDSPEEYLSYIRETAINRESFCRKLDELGIRYSKSVGNFLAIRLGEAATHDLWRQQLAQKNILIRRPFREAQLNQWVRVSTAPEEIQCVMIEELKKILKPKNLKGQCYAGL